MQLAIIGLGKMGMNMARRLIRRNHEVVAYNRTPDKIKEIEREGATGAYSLKEVVIKVHPPRIIWLMLPAGSVVEEHIEQLASLLSEWDIVVDGGNSYYKDSIRRFGYLKSKGIGFIDAGVSGGVWGLKNGYCTMAGGEREAFATVEPIFRDLAPPDGYMYCGGPGAGHFVKMVHNGIEYGMMQAYAEGFEILNASPYREELNFSRLAHLWGQGSVVRSWLLELLESAFKGDDRLSTIRGYVEDSGEGRWTVKEAIDLGVPAGVIALSLMRRFRSRQDESFGDKVIAALRNQFGGHEVKKKKGVGD
ncbi:MAG: phosphogluconate dehydrogenase (NAD(+)-dependent, decarboxylating) [bacterium]